MAFSEIEMVEDNAEYIESRRLRQIRRYRLPCKGVVPWCVLREFDLFMQKSKTAEMSRADVDVCIRRCCNLECRAFYVIAGAMQSFRWSLLPSP